MKIGQVENLKNDIKSLNKYKLSHSDPRLGRKICLAVVEDYSVVEVKTDFMTVNEMYFFLRGLHMRENNLI